MASLYRMQVILKNKSGLASDSASNNLWVYDGDAAAPAVEPLAEVIRNFYTEDTVADSLPRRLSFAVADTGHEIRVYEHDITTGARLPYDGAPPDHVEVFDFISRTPASDAVTLPGEVACCLSIANVGSSAVPAARRRGRIYLGPLSEGTIAKSATTGRVTVATGFRDKMLANANVMVDGLRALLGGDGGLCVYSRPYAGRDAIVRPGRTTLPALPARNGAAYLVNEVSMDDAMDTVRSRGTRPTIRTRLTA